MASDERTIQKVPEKEEDIQPEKLMFYCHDCGKTVAAATTKRKFSFKCKECGSPKVAYGTATSVKNFYRLAE